jgi:hypothetical protein
MVFGVALTYGIPEAIASCIIVAAAARAIMVYDKKK